MDDTTRVQRLEAADALWAALAALNLGDVYAAERYDQYDAPVSPYARVKRALIDVLADVADGDRERAFDLYNAVVDTGEYPSTVYSRVAADWAREDAPQILWHALLHGMWLTGTADDLAEELAMQAEDDTARVGKVYLLTGHGQMYRAAIDTGMAVRDGDLLRVTRRVDAIDAPAVSVTVSYSIDDPS